MTIPTNWSNDAEDGMKEFCVLPDKTVVEFIIEECVHDTMNFREVTDAEVWKLKLICKSGNMMSTVYQTIYKEGRSAVWNDKDSSGKTWIQNKFLNLCSAVNLRRSGEQVNINPKWFSEPALFIEKRGRAVVGVETYNGKTYNRINWFNSPTEQQELQNELINNRILGIAPVQSSQPVHDDPFA